MCVVFVYVSVCVMLLLKVDVFVLLPQLTAQSNTVAAPPDPLETQIKAPRCSMRQRISIGSDRQT